MRILDRLPISDRPHLITVGEEPVEVYRNQIVVWISINDALRPFPALLDTGHSHNLSISAPLLRRWSGALLEEVGELEIGDARVAQFGAEVRIHRNLAGQTRLRGDSFPLEMPQGISVFEQGSPEAPRLPLIGLRTLVSNRLRLLVDGQRREVTLRTRGWF
jgi:hypothetical protein